MDDPWDDLLWCRRHKREGRVNARMTRTGRTGDLSPARVVSVSYPSGREIESQFYGLRPFEDQNPNWSSRVVYFAMPVNTTGLTIVFEPKAW